MNRGLIAGLLRRTTAEPGDPPTDAELLARYLRARDEAAFELLVWRHAVMVAGVCRRVVADVHLAEDAFQAVFIVLARKAGSVRGANLAGWLFRVARRVAVRARRQATTRASREAPLADRATVSEPCPVAGRERLAILDEEIARLPERFRLPVLLCYLGGTSTEEAGRILGCPRGTILSRLATARQRLADRLTRRGVTLPAGGLVVVAGIPGVASVAGLVSATVPAALAPRVAIPSPGGGPTASTLLAEGVIRAMKTGQLLTAAGVVVLALGVVAGVGAVAARPGPSATADEPVAVAQKDNKPAPPPAAQKDEEARREAERVRQRQLRDARMRKLEQMADELRGQIQAKERAIQSVARSGADTGREADRLQESVRRLDTVIAATEHEALADEAMLSVLKKRLADHNVRISDQDVALAVETNPEVSRVAQRRDMAAQEIEALLRSTKADSPLMDNAKARLAQADKALADERTRARARAEATYKATAEEQLRRRIAESEETLEVKKAVLAALVRKRDEAQSLLTKRARDQADVQPLLKELEPLRDALNKIEMARIQLLIDDEGAFKPTSAPEAVNAKLAAVLRELQELRKDVRELRKR